MWGRWAGQCAVQRKAKAHGVAKRVDSISLMPGGEIVPVYRGGLCVSMIQDTRAQHTCTYGSNGEEPWTFGL